MATFRYRAATATGAVRTGAAEAVSRERLYADLKRSGLMPIEAQSASAPKAGSRRIGGGDRQGLINALGELAVLLEAGLPLDRALSVCVDNITSRPVRAAFDQLLAKVKAGAPLSRALEQAEGFFPPMASAMAEAGEANGQLGAALTRLAASLDRAFALRQTVISSLVYPAVLMTVATSVVLVMLLVVVPQFQNLLADAHGKLPLPTRVVLAVSQIVRSDGLFILAGIVVAIVGARAWLRRPSVRLAFDRWVLGTPLIGTLVRNAETAMFARTLGSLVEGGVALPTALSISRRSVSNTHMSAAIAKVAAGLKEGAGLTGPLAASGVFPRMAMSFLRTGEETARIGMMLERLADVLDRQVRSTLTRLLAILTPAVTVLMGGMVATVIASIMSAIIGFNDLALGQ
ncbi:MAG TPA: type II secretion system F family protein [Caulobacteraceae bacterium]|nr:type II secretion system F family protein [Caulobacteraceae bacterium]